MINFGSLPINNTFKSSILSILVYSLEALGHFSNIIKLYLNN